MDAARRWYWRRAFQQLSNPLSRAESEWTQSATATLEKSSCPRALPPLLPSTTTAKTSASISQDSSWLNSTTLQALRARQQLLRLTALPPWCLACGMEFQSWPSSFLHVLREDSST